MELVVNGQEKIETAKAPKHIIRIKNQKWSEGDPENERYFLFPLPEHAGAEIRVNALGYSIYFDHTETRAHPLASRIEMQQQRVIHTEIFFQAIQRIGSIELVEVLSHIKYTDWETVTLSQEARREILMSKSELTELAAKGKIS